MSRPSKRTPEMETVIARALGMGMSYDMAARLVGIHPETLREWRKADEDLSARLDMAIEHGVKRALVCVLKAFKRGDWRAAAWWLERRVPEFRPRPAPMDGETAASVESQARQLHALRDAMLASVPSEDDGHRVNGNGRGG